MEKIRLSIIKVENICNLHTIKIPTIKEQRVIVLSRLHNICGEKNFIIGKDNEGYYKTEL